jgi:mono/diheme cytochrome c family protein
MTARPLFLVPGLLLALVQSAGLVGCDRSRFDMLAQPKLGPDAASPLFEDSKATRPPPPGSVAHAMDEPALVSSGRNGTDALQARDAAEVQQSLPERPPRSLLLRGQERYAIYCMPCHSPVGDGDGPVVRRGFPAPPSFHQDRLRTASDRHIYEVITHGFGIMYPLADRIEPVDRWAIVAFVRALQLSRHAPASEVAQASQTPGVADASAAWRAVPPATEVRR